MSLLTKVSQAAPARPLCPRLEELQGTEQRSCSLLSAVSRELQTSLLLPSVRLQGSDKTARSSCPPGGRQVSWLWSLPGYRHASPSPLPSGKAMPEKLIFLPAQIIRAAAGWSSHLLLHADAHLQERILLRAELHPKAGAPSQQESGWTVWVVHTMVCAVFAEFRRKKKNKKHTLIFKHTCVFLFWFVFFAITHPREWELFPTTTFCSSLPISVRWEQFYRVGLGVWRQGISCQHFFCLLEVLKQLERERKKKIWLTEAMPRLTWTPLASGSSQKLQVSALKTGVTWCVVPQWVSVTVLHARLRKEVAKSNDEHFCAFDMNFKHNAAFQTFPLTKQKKNQGKTET